MEDLSNRAKEANQVVQQLKLSVIEQIKGRLNQASLEQLLNAATYLGFDVTVTVIENGQDSTPNRVFNSDFIPGTPSNPDSKFGFKVNRRPVSVEKQKKTQSLKKIILNAIENEGALTFKMLARTVNQGKKKAYDIEKIKRAVNTLMRKGLIGTERQGRSLKYLPTY